MRKFEKIEGEIFRVLGDRRSAGLSVALMRFIVSSDEQLSHHLTYRHIGQILKVDPTDADLQSALALLCGRFRVLQFHMEFFDELGDAHPIPDDDLTHFLATGEFAHPYTGQVVENPDASLVPYFSASRSDLMGDAKNG